MTAHVQRASQVLPLPLEDVFAFFARPENLARITPPELGFVLLSSSPVRMEAGCLIDYRIRVLGLPLRWTSVITAYEPPHRFVDEQRRGPYASWRHVHGFSAVPGGTLIADEVTYELPLGPLGEVAHVLFVRRQLARIFAYRAARIGALLAEPELRGGGPA